MAASLRIFSASALRSVATRAASASRAACSALARLQSGFALFGLLDATGIFSCSSFGRSLAACQLFGTLLGSSLSSGLATGLSSGTRTCLGYLFGNEPVDLCIECSVFLALLGYDALNGTLLFLQALHHILLLGLLVFKV